MSELQIEGRSGSSAANEEADAILQVIATYGARDIHIETESLPWVPYVADGMYFRPLRFDVVNGRYDVILWIQHPGVLGRHQHNGEVTAYTLEGSWYYREYDWVAKAGHVVHEAPGGIHTLCVDDPQGMKTLFHVVGTLDFFGDDDSFAGKQSVFWFLNEYIRYCATHAIEVNRSLIY